MENKVMNALGLIQLGALLGALITSAVAWDWTTARQALELVIETTK